MQFTSIDFALFFAVVFTVYWLLSKGVGRTCWLLGASIHFYATWSIPLAFLVCATGLLNFVVGLDYLRRSLSKQHYQIKQPAIISRIDSHFIKYTFVRLTQVISNAKLLINI